ncbi:MAG: putative phage abortive infection protein [Paludibacter sp.]|nr:putative phage abortive infection protein [Paludibacter sp.]
MRIFLWIISVLLIFVGITVSFIFFRNLSLEYTVNGNSELLLDKTGQVGDFIGGVVGTIFSLAGFAILIITLSAQTQVSYTEQFENKFFELIRLHRENLNEISITRKSKNEEGTLIDFKFTGRQVFKIVLDDFLTCRNELRQYFHKFELHEIYENEYLKHISEILNVEESHIRVRTIARIDIAYCIVFYGVGNEGYKLLCEIFNKRYKKDFYIGLLNYIQMKPIKHSRYWEEWDKFRNVNKVVDRLVNLEQIITLRRKNIDEADKRNQNQYYYDTNYIKYYGGHQFRLGHYYRHLFQTVKYVNSQNRLNFKQKYFYAKTLRAQLSTYEQALLFINSLSILGHPWELNCEYKKSHFLFLDKRRKEKNKLITRYNLIKNMPGTQMFGIVYTHYYPNVKYEIQIF